MVKEARPTEKKAFFYISIASRLLEDSSLYRNEFESLQRILKVVDFEEKTDFGDFRKIKDNVKNQKQRLGFKKSQNT